MSSCARKQELKTFSVKQLRSILRRRNITDFDCLEKIDFIHKIVQSDAEYSTHTTKNTQTRSVPELIEQLFSSDVSPSELKDAYSSLNMNLLSDEKVVKRATALGICQPRYHKAAFQAFKRSSTHERYIGEVRTKTNHLLNKIMMFWVPSHTRNVT